MFKYVIHRSLTVGLQRTAVYIVTLECGPVPNVMAALLNVGGTLCSAPQSLTDAHY